MRANAGVRVVARTASLADEEKRNAASPRPARVTPLLEPGGGGVAVALNF